MHQEAGTLAPAWRQSSDAQGINGVRPDHGHVSLQAGDRGSKQLLETQPLQELAYHHSECPGQQSFVRASY